jgi:hypothetical protein
MSLSSLEATQFRVKRSQYLFQLPATSFIMSFPPYKEGEVVDCNIKINTSSLKDKSVIITGGEYSVVGCVLIYDFVLKH